MDTKKRNKSNNYCSVPGCSTYYSNNISFHKFPGDKNLREAWVDALKIGKPITSYMQVCSQHFRNEDYFFNRNADYYHNKNFRLKKNVIPSQNLPSCRLPLKKDDNLIQQKDSLPRKRQKLNNLDSTEEIVEGHSFKESRLTTTNSYTALEKEAASTLMNFAITENVNVCTQKVFEDKAIQVTSYEDIKNFNISDIINTDHRVRIFTGIKNLGLLNVLVQYLSKLDNSNSKLSSKEMILLTLMRIKLDLPFTTLSIFFNISASNALTYFKKTIINLAHILNVIIKFPSKSEIFGNMPVCFSNFPDTRIILDFIEIVVQKRKCLKYRIGSNSYCKGRQTVKFLIGTAPSGLIIFVSKAYSGRTSGKIIFNKEQLIKKLSASDAIMADKGFLIDKECATQNIRVIRAPFLKEKKQLSKSEALRSAEIRRARVHIKRIIQRVKHFRIFRNIWPRIFLPYVHNIITVIVALTNLSNPTLPENKFW